ncbi:MAG: 2-C-methyl-D-erythritol 4-phosphate cytidylyltransferase, partial [Thermodesulfobacteriota bacterium]|nr:2-C-methyl-D-erythritol 4-phosphate cytidylyltransferase [Thermodesulfobacteriota bacterium]
MLQRGNAYHRCVYSSRWTFLPGCFGGFDVHLFKGLGYRSNMISAIIVAAGKGIRMNDKTRKQYLLLAGRPVLAYSLLAFDTCDLIDCIILVVPKKDIDYCWKDILAPLDLRKKINLVPGGEKRQDSVYNGLMAVDKDAAEIVVIHDGVRPFVSQEQVVACITGAKEYGACIPAIPANDTLKQVD